MMLSRVIPLEYLKERDIMFWLPPGGVDNDVWADTWVPIAELESTDVATVLDLLRDCDIGGYAARPRGLNTAGAGRQLYVDAQQYNKATDVLMLFLRAKEQPAMPRAERIAPKLRSKIKIPRPVALVLTIVVGAALIALFLLLVYAKGSQMWPGVHPGQHPAPNSDGPGIKRSNPQANATMGAWLSALSCSTSPAPCSVSKRTTAGSPGWN